MHRASQLTQWVAADLGFAAVAEAARSSASTYEVTVPTAERMNEPIDACEVRCAHEMAAKLTELGAREE